MFFRPPLIDDGTVSDDPIDDGTVDFLRCPPVDDGTVDFDDGTVSDLVDDGTVDSPVFRALAHYAH